VAARTYGPHEGSKPTLPPGSNSGRDGGIFQDVGPDGGALSEWPLRRAAKLKTLYHI
jgi:hypothetical protein